MTPLSYSHTGAAIVFYGLLAVFALLEQITRVRSLLNRAGERRDQGSFFALAACIGGAFAGAFVLASDVQGATISTTAAVRWALFVCGCVVLITGIALRRWAIALLGPLFTVDVRVQADQRVVDTGPYRWVRHPSYSGMMLVFLGAGLCLGNWLSLACLVLVPLAGLIARIRIEERVLASGLGEAYERFAAGRARLIPHVW